MSTKPERLLYKSPVRRISSSPLLRSAPTTPRTSSERTSSPTFDRSSSPTLFDRTSSLDKSSLPSFKRTASYTRSPLSSPQRPTYSRSNTFSSLFSESDVSGWTSTDWRKLEEWYVKKDRDHLKAANAFYYHESLLDVDLGDERQVVREKWSKQHVIWRSQCLDTSVKAHQGLLPSERKKKKRRLDTGGFKEPERRVKRTTPTSSLD